MTEKSQHRAKTKRARRRHRAERRFQIYGAAAVLTGIALLAALLISIGLQGYGAFTQTHIRLDIHFDADVIDPDGSRSAEALREANYAALAKRALYARFPEVQGRRQKRKLSKLLSSGVDLQLRDMVAADTALIGTTRRVWVIASDDVDMMRKGQLSRDLDEELRPLNDRQLRWLDGLDAAGDVERQFNTGFFVNGDSRDPELAGILNAAIGSIFTLVVTLILSFPIGVAAAVYLEEFAPRNRWTHIIEVNINNLAAVPSIVFGLLALSVFLGFFGLPRSAPLVGGMVLALMTLPTVIIAGRAALMAVPPSIREAALSMGASKLQTVTHHVLPLAMPGILTGTIIGMARALGETAPLLMIGMVAFIVDAPASLLDPATALPVQIYLWSDMPERAFVERTSAAIIVLLGFLIAMNAVAIYLRKKFERRW